MSTIFDNKVENAWCPGCGNFGIQNAMKRAFSELNLEPRNVVLVSGIGQAAKAPHYVNTNVFNGLHGRAVPVAFAIKTVNPALTVIAESGDGCMYGEGGNHLLHNIRRNPDITVMVHNNQVYGLTKGQSSPTSEEGFVTKTQPSGNISRPFNPLSFAISQDASFVARAFSGDIDGLVRLLKEAIRWKGFSLIDILQPCVSFNKVNTYAWYRKRIEYLDEAHDPENRLQAFERSLEWGERILLGIFYRKKRPVYQERVKENLGVEDLLYRGFESENILQGELPRFR